MGILRLENIYKDFSGLEVLCGISLEVQRGERHAIIGPNGAGKSTVFNVITGLYKPSKGKIFFLNQDITGWPIHKIALLGLVRSFQITTIFPAMTVFENLRTAVVSKFNRRFNWTSLLSRSKEIQRECDRILEWLRLTHLRDVPACELSYGWQRRLEVSLTLALDPVLILLDEPTAGVDVKETRTFVEFMKEATEGKTLVLVEHDMDVVFNIADRVTVLNNGTVLVSGTLNEIRENEEVQKAYAGRK
ncbi:MAG: ABC transporter ATP-binding protein [Thermodesulfobacteriota bacterium]